MSLQDTEEDLLDQVKEGLAVVAAGGSVREAGDVFESLAAALQARACCRLLTSMDRAGFFKNLVLSAYARRYYLRKSREQHSAESLNLAISRTESFFDAVAAGAMDLAREVVDLSPTEWIRDGEYEDDFCYYHFLHCYVRTFPAPDVRQLGAVLTRFERVLDGKPSPRLRACRSLLDRDREAFREAFESLVDDREQEVLKAQLGDDLTLETRAHLFVEGLALLQLAELAGVSLDGEYEHCPSVARATGTPPRPDDIFQDLERQFGL